MSSSSSSPWMQLGEVATTAQLVGLDAVKLISLIVKAANNARMHKKNCKRFAQHLNLIGNLLQQLKLSDLKDRPETSQPLQELEDALRRAYLLVNSCQSRSYFYLLALGWHIVIQFKDSQREIDTLLRLIPLITLVDNNRERLHAIEKDQHEYTMDDEERKVQDTILKSEPPTEYDAMLLQQSLASSYPGLPFPEALQKEKEKLRMELQRMQEAMELDQCDVIQHLIYMTDSANSLSQRRRNVKSSESKPVESEPEDGESTHRDGDSNSINNMAVIEYRKQPEDNDAGSTFDETSNTRDWQKGNHSSSSRWHNRLYHFYRDPYLCIASFMYPCGTFVNITTVVTDGKISQEDACNEFLIFTLFLGCYCYTCCVRRKLRKRYGISGGSCDDFWAHVFCFSCALIQEWREILAREGKSLQAWKMSAPQVQIMER